MIKKLFLLWIFFLSLALSAAEEYTFMTPIQTDLIVLRQVFLFSGKLYSIKKYANSSDCEMKARNVVQFLSGKGISFASKSDKCDTRNTSPIDEAKSKLTGQEKPYIVINYEGDPFLIHLESTEKDSGIAYCKALAKFFKKRGADATCLQKEFPVYQVR